MKIIQIPGVKYFGTIPTISVVNFQEESWGKQANVLAISPNCFHLWLCITDGRVRAECRMFITNFFEASSFFTSTSLWKKFSLSQVFLGELCQVKGRACTIIRILTQGVGKWDWHASSAWSVTRICPWWIPTFAQVCLSPVGPVPFEYAIIYSLDQR